MDMREHLHKMGDLRKSRKSAQVHLENLVLQQSGVEPFLFCIAEAIEDELHKIIRSLDEEISDLRLCVDVGDCKRYVQRAFEFVYEYRKDGDGYQIEKDEVPF